MPIVSTKGGPLLFGPPRAPGPLKKPRVVVETQLVEKAMAALIPEILTQAAGALNKFAEEVVTIVMHGTPVDTGDLQDSVRREKVSKTKTMTMVAIKAGGIEGQVRGEPINYAIIVHQLGSPKGRGRFFVIDPALKMGEAWLPKIAKRAVERAVDKVKAPRRALP